MSEAEEIRKLKDVGINAENPNVKKKTIDALAAYGNQAIDSIVDIVDIVVNPEVKEHGLDAIKRIKEEKDDEGNG